MFERLGRLAVRRFAWVIAAWVAAAAAFALLAPPLEEVLTFDSTAFLTADAQSVRAHEALEAAWPDDDFGNATAVILERRTGSLHPADLDYLRTLEAWLAGPEAPEVVERTTSELSRPDMARFLRSKDGASTLLLVRMTTPPFEPPTNEAVREIRAHVASTRPAALGVEMTGEAAVGADQDAAIRTSVDRTTAITLVLVVLILLFIYRSPVAPLVPLLTVGAAFGVAQGLIALLAQAGMQVSSLVETFMVVIIFGAGTDYCLFVISRFREDVARTHEYRATLAGTIAIVGAVVASSAGTVIVGFMAQGTARFGMFRTVGPAMAVAVLVTLVAGLTLTPALMRAFGRILFWPAHPERDTAPPSARAPATPVAAGAAPPGEVAVVRARRAAFAPVSGGATDEERTP